MGIAVHKPEHPAPNIDQVVRELREVYCVSGLRLAVSVGKLVLDRIYGGDIDRWRSRGRKDTSFRTLARHPDLPFSAATLSRSVGIYLVSLRRPDLLALPNLGPSHVRELLGLESNVQDRLLDQANERGWSVEQVRERVSHLQPNDLNRLVNKRPPPSFVRYLRRLRRAVDGRALLETVEHLDQLDSEQAEELLATVRRLCSQAETVARHLAEHLGHRPRESGAAEPFTVPAARPSAVVPKGVSTWKQEGLLPRKRRGS
jgi:hypothetical protein